jgi:hypothetical protein
MHLGITTGMPDLFPKGIIKYAREMPMSLLEAVDTAAAALEKNNASPSSLAPYN